MATFWDIPASLHDRRRRRVSETNQIKKCSQQKVEDSDRFGCLDLRKSRLQAGLDKYLVLEPFTILKCQITPLALGTLAHFRHFRHFCPFIDYRSPVKTGSIGHTAKETQGHLHGKEEKPET